MHFNIHPKFQKYSAILLEYIAHFNTTGILFIDGARNKIKLFELEQQPINIKSFKVPNIINQVVYKFLRKSKARRSYEFANRLIENGIGTPQPIAYLEEFTFFGLGNSYYVSEQLEVDLTFRELVEIPDYPDHENILRKFVQFSFQLHEKGIEFLDHSPGNTLIKKVAKNQYRFYLVDLNRMNFLETMSIDDRMKNLSRLTPKRDMIVAMSDEYAKLYGKNQGQIFDKMWHYTSLFQKKYRRKTKLKNKIKVSK